ncbi:hypothetical protein ACHAQH_009859 [Verticillium albo-atrum]
MDADDLAFLRSQQLVIDPTARVLICGRPNCLTGLSPKTPQVNDHLNRKHRIPAEVRVSQIEDEVKIAMLCQATRRVVTRVRPNSCYPKPFMLVAKEGTRDVYVSVLQRFVALVFQAYRLPPKFRRDEAGVLLTDEQLRACQQIWDHPSPESKTLVSAKILDPAPKDCDDGDDWEEDYEFNDQQSSASSDDDDEDPEWASSSDDGSRIDMSSTDEP